MPKRAQHLLNASSRLYLAWNSFMMQKSKTKDDIGEAQSRPTDATSGDYTVHNIRDKYSEVCASSAYFPRQCLNRSVTYTWLSVQTFEPT